MAEQRLNAVFLALGDPTRRRLLSLLLEGDRTVGALAGSFEMSLAAISKHLAILARAGLISQLRSGRSRTCRLEPAALQEAALWMTGFGSFEADAFDVLERYLAEVLDDDDALSPARPDG